MIGRGRLAAKLRRTVRDMWASDSPGAGHRLLLDAMAPAEAVFRAGIALRNARYDRTKAVASPMPVVSVGNLVVGGTGKTPVIRWLHEWYSERGVAPTVISRGYGGDEIALCRRWFGQDAVFVGASRIASVQAAFAQGRYSVALLDDGYQHRRLSRDVDILLVAAEDPPRGRLVPRGPYREPLSAAKRATHLLLTRRTPDGRHVDAWRSALGRVVPGLPLHEVEMVMGGWRDLSGAAAAPPQGDVLAVSAIARPGAFVRGLAKLLPGAAVESVDFADHHAYTRSDADALLARCAGRSLVCTEKDAVKLAAFPELAPHCVTVGLRVAGPPPGALQSALAAAVECGCSSR